MSFQAMAWAVQQELPMREKMVLLMLANYASNERGDCYPSISVLAKDCGAGKDTIIRAIKTLEDAGLLTIKRRQQEGVNLPNTYTLNMQGVVANCDHGSRSQQGGVVASCDTNLLLEPINTSSLRSDVKARAPEKSSVQSELMKVLDEDHAKAVIDHRKALKKPLTVRAAQLLAKQFAQCPDPNTAADAMIENCWQGFKPEWLHNQKSSAVRREPPPKTRRVADDIRDEARRLGILPDEPDSHQTRPSFEGYETGNIRVLDLAYKPAFKSFG